VVSDRQDQTGGHEPQSQFRHPELAAARNSKQGGSTCQWSVDVSRCFGLICKGELAMHVDRVAAPAAMKRGSVDAGWCAAEKKT
jgi:hypothetical protein